MYKEDFNLPAKVTPTEFAPNLSGLIAWLETQPEGYYKKSSPTDCLLCRFFTVVTGRTKFNWFDVCELFNKGSVIVSPTLLGKAAYGDHAEVVMRYSDTLKRARDLQAEHPGN